MKRTTRSLAVTWLTCLSLALSLSSGILMTDRASAASQNQPAPGQARKVAPDLETRAGGSAAGTVSVIVQLSRKPSGQLNALLNRNGVHVRKLFKELNTQVVDLPASVVDELATFDEVSYVSPDRQLASSGHASQTSGAAYRRSQTSATGTSYTLNGTGIGIAIIDSGVFAGHKALADASGQSRVVYSEDFTGENRTDDPYGHGTHVAGIAAGNKQYYNAAYSGIALNAKIINLRVLNALGRGTTSSVLAALDWLMANRSTYNIRVANMSLGMLAIDSYRNDPLCNAVRRLVNAGVVVVAAAGNNGKDSTGAKVYGQIHSPGNEPSAITVGAANSYGTDARGDDTIATYSSRGPTRSYSTDAYGVKHYDNIMKPDIVAPGNKIVAAEAPNNLLAQQNPLLDVNLTLDSNNKMMYLSGTSMATPVTAGAAAMLLQMNPNLTPNMVKMILMYTAQPLAGFNTLEQGAGEINIAGAVDLTKVIRTDITSSTTVGAALLTTNTPPAPQTTISDYTFQWAQGILLNRTYAKGSELITKYQGVYAAGVLLSDGVLLSNGVLLSDATMMSSGVLLGDSIVNSNGGSISDGTSFCATGVLLGDGVLLSDGVILGDGVLLSDGVLLGDSIRALSVPLYGDNTACMN